MGKIALNRICGEELEGKTIEVIRDLSGQGAPCSSTIQTALEMNGYFVTQSDLQRALRDMTTAGKIKFIPPRMGLFSDGGYRLK